jgi:hypothetical protein
MSSTRRSLTYRDLARLLAGLGFAAESSRPEYLLFRHVRPEVLIVLPARWEGDLVDAAHLQAVRTHVLENGLATVASFERLLHGTEAGVASQ